MSEVQRLPDARRAEREASEWIARLQADDVSVEDRARFEAWRDAHALHARAYRELSRTWQQFMAAGPFVRAVSFAQSINGAVTPPRRWLPFAAAAALLVVVCGLYLAQRAPPAMRFNTAVGEQLSVSLPDGSRMELNSDSVAQVEYRPHSRIIRLQRGEAFFQVAHDVTRPFWVVGSDSWVRAVGTAFNVYLRATGMQVTVSEGTVKVATAVPVRLSTEPSDAALAQTSASVLSAGQQAELRGAVMTTRHLSSAELSRSVAWRGGTVSFDNRPLGDVIEELSRYTPLSIVLVDDRLRQLAVGGTFQANPQGAEALLSMLEQGFGLRVRRDENTIYIDNPERPSMDRPGLDRPAKPLKP